MQTCNEFIMPMGGEKVFRDRMSTRASVDDCNMGDVQAQDKFPVDVGRVVKDESRVLLRLGMNFHPEGCKATKGKIFQ